MKNYKRLTKRDREKIKFFKKLKQFMKTSAKWWLIGSLTLVLLLIGLFYLYIFVDNQNTESNSSAVTPTIAQEDGENLDELTKKELERENKKIEKIDSIDGKEQTRISNESDAEEEIEEKVYDFSSWNESCPYEMTVINKSNYISADTKVKTSLCRGKEIAEVACQNLEKMILDAKKQGVNLWISSGYRSIGAQTNLFNRQVAREKSKAIITQEQAEIRAARVVAKPRTSEHHLGLAVDFNGVEDNFYKTKEYEWLIQNAHNYGFIERYRKEWTKYTGVIYEPWHFRYVGEENAKKIKESKLCLERYIEVYLIK